MPTRRIGFGAVGILGNTPGTLDYIPTKYINHEDLCIVHENGKLYFYRMDIFRGGAHNPPYIVKCQNLEDDTSINATLKKWFLISQELYSTNIVQYLTHYFKTYEIKAHSNEDLIFTTGLGENIVIQSDGKVILPSTASGLDPVNDTDFVTKQYLQNLIPRGTQGEKCFAESDEWEQEESLYKCELDLSECVEVEPISDDRWELWTTGANYNGESGVGDNETIREQPKLVLGEEWEEIIPDLYRTFGIKKDGTLWATGLNVGNNLGTENSDFEIHEFTQIGNAQWKKVLPLLWGWGNSCVVGIQEDGSLWTWGTEGIGGASKLGHGSIDAVLYPTKVGTEIWRDISNGNDCTAAIRLDGTLWTTGWNGYGQLGLGHTDNQTTFQQVGSDTWKSVVVTRFSSGFGIKTNGTLWSWGRNNGELGLGEEVTENILSPTQIGTDSDWKEVISVFNYAFAIKENGTLWAWGHNSYGQLGLGDAIIRYSPTQVGSDSDWKSVVTDGFTTWGMKKDNTLWGWGNNTNYQVGLSYASDSVYTPTQIGIGAFKKVSTMAEIEGAVALKFDGSVWGWGGNWHYQMGIGEQYGIPFQRLNQRTWNNVWAGPTQVFYQEKILEIENEICQTTTLNSNASSSSAIDGYGRWWAWGQNFVAQAGAGYFEFNAEKPYEYWFERYDKPENYYVVSPRLVENVEHKTDFVKICQGEYGQMAMDASGRLWGFGQSANSHDAEGNCAVWGIPHGSGYNETGTIFGAVHCAPGHTFKDFAYNYYYTHMIGHDDKLYGMGYEYGYFGTGGFGIGYRIELFYETPTLIPAVSEETVRLILANDDSGMGGVVTTDGRVLVWGAGVSLIVDGYDASVQYVVDITDNLPEDKEILMIKASHVGIVALLDDGTAWARIGYGYLAGKGWDGEDDPYEWLQIENIPKIRYMEFHKTNAEHWI
jgi:alpha-tubulin suppressor-like RCC1 family protein